MSATVSLRYDPDEDRLLLHLGAVTGEGAEQVSGLWITRRVCADWRRDLQAMVDMSAETPTRLDPVAKAAVSQAHHQAMASQVPVRSEKQGELESARTTPPTLVHKIVCGRRRNDGQWVVRFERSNTTPLTLTLGSAALHALVDALSSRLKLAKWNLDEMPVEKPVPAVPPTGASFH